MARGGKRPGAGRPAGAANAKTRAIADKASAEGITPLEYMLQLLRDKNGDPLTRFEAAKAAAPYMHAKLSSVESKVEATHTMVDPVDRPPRETREQWQERRAREVGMGTSTRPSG